MREVITQSDDKKTTVAIKSPWLSSSEACVYLGIASAEFYASVANAVPFRKVGRRRLYNCHDLDDFGKEEKYERIR